MRAASTAWAASVLLLQLCAGAAEDALLLVKSEPSGAGVFVDGDTDPRGTTPCVVLVAPGPHRVRLELGDLRASAEAVAIAGAPVTVELKLTAPEASPQRTQRTPRTPRAGGSVDSVSSVARVLAEFDSLIDKGDYAGARRGMEGARDTDAGVAGAAIRLADALAARKSAIRRAAGTLKGKEAEIRTTKGKLSGKVERVGDEGIVLLVVKRLPGAGAVEMRMKVKWSDLTPKQEDEFAESGGWRPEGADTPVVQAYIALARRDARAAERAVAAAGDHALAVHLRRRLDAPKREASARAAWAAIEGKARAKALSASQAKSLLERTADFQREYADTDCAATVAKELAAVKARAEAALEAGALLLGLVGWWRFDGRGARPVDSSGNGEHGVNFGAVRVRGRIGGALEFDGMEDYVDCGTAPGSAEAITVAFWMKADMVKHQIPLDKDPGDESGIGWTIKLRDNCHVYWRIGSSRSLDQLSAPSAYAARTWVHMAFTFEAGTSRIYVDGSHAASKTGVTQTVNNKARSLYMGRVPGRSERFAGLLDDVRIYDRALSAAEIAVLYRADAQAGETAEPGPPETAPEPPPGDVKRRSTGLLGTYFSGRDHDRPVVRRIDQQVDFDWGKRPPDPRVPADDFSVRWEGFLLAPVTGRYVFHVDSDNGFRMWFSGKLIVDKWVAQRVREQSSAVSLAKGRFYPVRIEHMDATGDASVHLRWTGPGTREPVPVPGDLLRPPPNYEKLPGPPFAEGLSPPP